MKKLLSFVLAAALMLSLCVVTASASSANDKINWILNTAKGSGEFSYEFELAPTQAQITAGQPGQTGIVQGKDGLIRVYHENRTEGMPNGTYTEATNSNAMAVFARNYRLLTVEQAQSWFSFEGDEMTGATATDFNGNTVTKKISNLKNTLSDVAELDNAPRSTKTMLWWIIDAARGNGAFSYEFELPPSAAQIEAGTHGQRGIVEGKDGVIRVYHLNANGTYTEATNSNAMAIFANNYRLLTQRSHNHNNEVTAGDAESRSVAPSTFPAWLGLTTSAWANGNFELFPLVSHATLATAANPYEMNLAPARGDTVTPEERAKDMLFIYENGVMAAARYFLPNGDVTFKKISNLKNELSGVAELATANRSTKTQLWWIINSARGNGAFSFDYQLENGTKGKVVGNNGTVTTYIDNGDGTYRASADCEVASNVVANFRFLTQFTHNHNNEVTAGDPMSRPFNTFPAWLGLSLTSATWGNGNFELFPLVAGDVLANAVNPFEMNLTPMRGAATPTPEQRKGDMLFIYENGAMVAAYYDNTWIKISGLQNVAVNVPVGTVTTPATTAATTSAIAPVTTSAAAPSATGTPKGGVTIAIMPVLMAAGIAIIASKKRKG